MTDEKRAKKSANFALELYGEKSAEGLATWFEVKDGFVSPKQALEYAEAKKIQGAVRAVRVASAIYGGSVVNPEPVYTLKKIETEEKKPGKKPRVKRASRPDNTQLLGQTAQAPVASPYEPADEPAPAPEPEEQPAEEALPPDEGGETQGDEDATP